ncbi:MAG: DUF4012 domain-containing protein [bacterium]|nr:DUF4012 domain-containing protein [bacterium]
MPSRKRLFVIVGAVTAVIVIGLAVWLAVNVLSTARQGQQLQDDVNAAKASISRLDIPAASADLQAVIASSTALDASTDGLAWRLAEQMPFIGDSARAASAFASAARVLSVAAQPLISSVGGQDTTTGKLMAVISNPEAVTFLRTAAQQASDELGDISPDGLNFGLDAAVTDAQASLPGLVSALDEVARSTGPMTSMLGADKPTTWLVMAQNPAELRGSGGLFSAYLLVTLNDGQMEIVEAGSRKGLDGEFPMAEQIPYWEAVSPETAGTWGPALGEWASFNIPPDFPTVAKLAAAGMKKRGTPVDGVIAIDPTVTAAILAGTGSVEHKGMVIDSSTAEEFFTKGLYQDFPGFDDVKAKDELAMGLTYATIDAALKRPLDAPSLWNAMSAAVEGGHLKAWSSNEADQAWLETTPVAAAFSQHPNDVVVGFLNGTGGKLDPYITRDVAIDYSRCESDKTVDLTIAMANEAPKGLPAYVDVTLDQDGVPDSSVPKGFSRTFVTAYAPGTTLEDASFLKAATKDGEKIAPSYGGTSGRPNWTVPVELNRGDSTQIAMTFVVTACPTQAI